MVLHGFCLNVIKVEEILVAHRFSFSVVVVLDDGHEQICNGLLLQEDRINHFGRADALLRQEVHFLPDGLEFLRHTGELIVVLIYNVSFVP